jgi:hypothetical protein
VNDVQSSRAAIVERLQALAAEQQALISRLVPEAKSWEFMGLDVSTGLMLAAADRPDEWDRIRQLGDALLTTLQELEAVDPSGPGPGATLVARMRWALRG